MVAGDNAAALVRDVVYPFDFDAEEERLDKSDKKIDGSPEAGCIVWKLHNVVPFLNGVATAVLIQLPPLRFKLAQNG
jgi:hypothetical protein